VNNSPQNLSPVVTPFLRRVQGANFKRIGVPVLIKSLRFEQFGLPVLLILLCLAGCATNHRKAIALETLSEPEQADYQGNDEEFIAKISAALIKHFPPGTQQDQLIDYAQSLSGKCGVDVDRTIFAPRDLQIGNVICTVPETYSLFLRSEIVINGRVENRKIVWLKVYRSTAHFP
jgi:hypothetical protein